MYQCIWSKVARNIGIIRKLKYQFPEKVLRLLYFSLVHPYLLYGCSVWSGTFYVHLIPLCVLQNSAMRAIFELVDLPQLEIFIRESIFFRFQGCAYFISFN